MPSISSQYISNEVPALNTSNSPYVDNKDNVINIQLPYDSNWLTEPELRSSYFA